MPLVRYTILLEKCDADMILSAMENNTFLVSDAFEAAVGKVEASQADPI